jgi:cytochrome-b5 reductase
MGTPFTLAAGAAVAGLGVYAFYLRNDNSNPDMALFSGFGFRTLKLESTELVNHNTKKLRFELPDRSQPSGLSLTSSLLSVAIPEGRWFPVFRPYTPVNDLSESLPNSPFTHHTPSTAS